MGTILITQDMVVGEDIIKVSAWCNNIFDDAEQRYFRLKWSIMKTRLEVEYASIRTKKVTLIT